VSGNSRPRPPARPEPIILPSAPPVTSPILSRAVSVLLFLGLVLIVQLSVGWSALLSAWEVVPFASVTGAVALVFISYALRALRVRYYFAAETKGHDLAILRIFLLHNLLNNLLPLRSGEISFPVMMKRAFAIPMARTVPGLMYLRLLDLYVIVLLGLVLAPWLGGVFRWGVFVTLAAVPILAFLGQRQLSLALEGRLGRLGRVLTQAISGFPSTIESYVGICLLTAGNWAVKLFVLAAVLRMFLPLPYPDALIGVVAGELTGILPINGLAGAGTYEGGVIAGLQGSGVGFAAGMAAAVNLHLFVLGVAVISGLLALTLPAGVRRVSPALPRGTAPRTLPRPFAAAGLPVNLNRRHPSDWRQRAHERSTPGSSPPQPARSQPLPSQPVGTTTR